jgi:hypothetical protein
MLEYQSTRYILVERQSDINDKFTFITNGFVQKKTKQNLEAQTSIYC